MGLSHDPILYRGNKKQKVPHKEEPHTDRAHPGPYKHYTILIIKKELFILVLIKSMLKYKHKVLHYE